MAKNESRTVWSSEQGDLRKREFPPNSIKSLTPSRQTVYLHRESKERRGKTVTVIKKLVLSGQDMKDMAKKLKQVCGSGGTVKDDTIEIQGEHRQKIAEALTRMGYKVKIAGG
jgi:translation initiation factor 1